MSLTVTAFGTGDISLGLYVLIIEQTENYTRKNKETQEINLVPKAFFEFKSTKKERETEMGELNPL